jgi:hypothetical protein
MWGDNPCCSDWPYVGTWLASCYTSDCRRIDHELVLHADDTYQWTTRDTASQCTVRGHWRHHPGETILRMEPEPPHRSASRFESWEVVQIPTWRMINILLLRRWLPIEPHNPPILFYRIQAPAPVEETTTGEPWASAAK